MDSRNTIILNVFSTWASDCRAEYHSRFENSDNIAHQKTLLHDAMIAFEAFEGHHSYADYSIYQASKNNFHKEAKTYFLYGLHMGDGLYETIAYRMRSFQKQWDTINTTLEASKDFGEILDKLPSYDKSYDIFHSIISENDFTNDVAGLHQVKKKLAKKQEQDFEEQFGESKVYEELGRYYARKHFEELNPKRGRPKRNWSNLDTYRAFTFYNIVKNINEQLVPEGFAKTSVSEVCELTFGENNLLAEYGNSEDIQWTLDNFFKLENKSIRGFLNSISRGKTKLQKADNWHN